MRCYTWKHGGITDGFDVVEDKHLGPVVALGENGRGRILTKIAIDRHDPAIVENARGYARKTVLVAAPRIVTMRRGTLQQRSFVTLARPTEHDIGVMVRVNTNWVYTRNTYGRVSPGDGCTVIAGGQGAYGAAGRIGTWQDAIVLLDKPGAWVRIQPNGGRKTVDWSIWLDKVWGVNTAPWDDYLMAMALEDSEQMEAEND